MRKPDNCLLVIFGASGDLTHRKLLPALFDLCRQDLLPERFAVLGVSRTQLTDQAFRERMADGVKAHAQLSSDDAGPLDRLAGTLYYQPVDTADPGDYGRVRTRLAELDRELGTGGNYVYYLATPPSLYETVADGLGAQGLTREEEGAGWRRIIVEKPFGTSLATAQSLNAKLQEWFAERQIYRIDHYLGKETVQNVLVFRFSNGIFEPLWNRNYVHDVQVTAAEDVGVGSRGRYYEGAGALRDMFQNHLLQVLAMVAMEPPSSFDATSVRNETMKVLQALRPLAPQDVAEAVVRGQYVAGQVGDERLPGYREEPDVDPQSMTETYVAMRLYVDNWRWGGVPFLLRTGKRLPMRATEVVLNFRETPHCLFAEACGVAGMVNQLVVRIQPDEGIMLRFGMKLPGAGLQVRQVEMDFHYSELSGTYLPSAYERLLLDCMLGDATLYTRGDAGEACWAFVEPVLQAWQSDESIKLYGYPAGSWGPREAEELAGRHETQWRYPCRSLAKGGEYCEL